MVLPRLPQRVEPAHAVPAHQDILQRVVEGVAHVKAAGDVGRRDHDREGAILGIGDVLAGLEGTGLFPGGVNPGLGLGRVKGLFHGHNRAFRHLCWGCKASNEGRGKGKVPLNFTIAA